MRTVIGNQSEGLAFASGTGSRGNGNQWKHTVFRFILSNPPYCPRCGVRTNSPWAVSIELPPPKPTITPISASCNLGDACTLESVGFSMDWSKRVTLEPLVFKQFHDSLGMPRRRQSGVRDQDSSFPMKAPRTQLVDGLQQKPLPAHFCRPLQRTNPLQSRPRRKRFISSGKEALTQAAIPMERRL